jgi:hypothetical protein
MRRVQNATSGNEAGPSACRASDACGEPHRHWLHSLVELEADAVHQWEAIERHQFSLVPPTFGV